jgi:hypothetical protein
MAMNKNKNRNPNQPKQKTNKQKTPSRVTHTHLAKLAGADGFDCSEVLAADLHGLERPLDFFVPPALGRKRVACQHKLQSTHQKSRSLN